jgi:dTDP-4-dehydro-6-deoxy-alpha-D-glucopyranose 2,3-dehydratase
MKAMSEYRSSFLHSAQANYNQFQSLEDTRQWLQARQQSADYKVVRIPLGDIEQWDFAPGSGDLRHRSGKFFSIAGLHCSPASNPAAAWEQPIIVQPEIGILGIITREFQGTRYLLMQAKMEPGNVNLVQLSPTLQATFSNFSQAHQGRLPPYTHYFLDPNARVINSQLQSETGTRFYRKFNRNILLDMDHDIDVLPGFRWLTLYEIQALMAQDDLVNMDSRSVISNIAYTGTGEPGERATAFQRSASCGPEAAQRSLPYLRQWLGSMRARYAIDTSPVSLNVVRDWVRDDWGIRHATANYFEIAGVRVEAGEREVPQWCQPLLKHEGLGLAGFLCTEIKGVLHFLLQAKPEPGIVESVELGPTVSLFDYLQRAAHREELPYLDYFLYPSADVILHSSIQSEEGGRFWALRNHFLVIKLPSADTIQRKDNYEWLTLAQLQQLSQGESLVNSEARTLLASLRLFH